jgi:hypothetical protein
VLPLGYSCDFLHAICDVLISELDERKDGQIFKTCSPKLDFSHLEGGVAPRDVWTVDQLSNFSDVLCLNDLKKSLEKV